MRASWKEVTGILTFALCAFIIPLISACGDAVHTSSETGSLAFSVEWRDAPTIQASYASVKAAPLDCEAAGVSTVEGKVYDENNTYLAGDVNDCEAHSGRITGVRVGTNRKLTILGKDPSGNVLYRGEKTGITVTAGQTNDAGTVVAELFTAILVTPEDGQTVGSVAFTWQPSNGASAYQIQVSTGSSFTSTVLDETVTTTSYTPTTTFPAGTYYWRVRSEDWAGDQSAWSEVWSFTVSPSAPIATITSPSDGSIYTEGNTISFSGTGEDVEDGSLTGSSLVWASSIDGEIGTGTSFTSNDLSVGTHTITLTATDSEGATGGDSVDITVTESGVDELLAKTELLKGYWYFYYTIISTFDHYYTLDDITGDTNSQGGYYIYGTDEYGNLVNACYWPDDEYWTLLDPAITIDRFYVFYTDGSTILEDSCYYQINLSTGDWSDCYTLDGYKVSSISARQVEEGVMEAIEAEEMRAIEGGQGTVDVSIEEKYWQLEQAIDSQK